MDAFKVVERVKVWQLFFVFGVALITLGLTGEVRNVTLIADMEIPAIVLGCVFVTVSVALRITPDPLKKRHDISIAQLEFASNFKTWERYENVTHDLLNSDYALSEDKKSILISTLRVELAIHQGLLESKIEDGQHYIRFIRPEDRGP
jgi:hypothetical protein